MSDKRPFISQGFVGRSPNHPSQFSEKCKDISDANSGVRSAIGRKVRRVTSECLAFGKLNQFAQLRSRSQLHRTTHIGGPNQVVSASASPRWVRSPTQATYPSGLIKTAVGAVTAPSAGSSHAPSYLASIN